MCSRDMQGEAMTTARAIAAPASVRTAVYWDGRHWQIVFVSSAVWLTRKGLLTARKATRDANRRYVAAGTDRLSELLAQAVTS